MPGVLQIGHTESREGVMKTPKHAETKCSPEADGHMDEEQEVIMTPPKVKKSKKRSKHEQEECELQITSKEKISKTPTSKQMKRKIQNGETEEPDFEHVPIINGEVTDDCNNNKQTPKLKKKKKHAETESSPEAAEQIDEEQEEIEAPKEKKRQKKKAKIEQEESEQQETEESEPQINGKKNKQSKAKNTSDITNGVVINEINGAPKAKKIKLDPEVKENQEESKSDDEETALEKMQGDFSNFPISEETIKNLKVKGVSYLFPIQVKTFSTAYSGKDVVVQARTGTGKTLSFAIPVIEKLIQDKSPLARGRSPRVLVLTPTRELAIQITNEIRCISKKLTTCCFYGGTPYSNQVSFIKSGIDILVGTPGRMKDLIQNSKLDLTRLKHVVLDEVDMMLDMGFAEQVEEILCARYSSDPNENPQTLLFSATCPDWMYNVAKKYMKPGYEKIDLVGHRSQKAAITVEHLAIECNRYQKHVVLGDVIQVYSGSQGKTIVFCDSKLEAHELSTNCPSLKQSAKALHGDLQQKEREVILKGFRNGTFNILIATNVAARGLDIPEVDLVVLYSAPKEADAYVHRSGRTGRAGRTGICISLYEPRDRYFLNNVERSTGIKFKRVPAPSVMNVAKSSSEDAIKALEAISSDVLENFKQFAEELIEKKGAVNALAAALAHMSGASSLTQRSLLNMDPDYVTVMLESSVAIHSLTYVWRAIKEQMGEEIDSKIHRMCLLKNSKGVCFDVTPETLKELKESWKESKRWTLSVPKDLPELAESRRDSEGPRGRGYGGRSYGGRGFGGRGRGGNGKGRGSGNRSSFQRGGDRRGGFRKY